MRPFVGPTVYDSEEEADIHGIAYGQRIIDEKVPGLKAGKPTHPEVPMNVLDGPRPLSLGKQFDFH